MATNNVVPLPTAAPRKVQQRFNRHLRAYKEANPWPGEYKRPAERQAVAMVAKAERSLELLILLALLKALPADQTEAIQNTVHRVHFAVGDDVSLLASSLIAGIKGEGL